MAELPPPLPVQSKKKTGISPWKVFGGCLLAIAVFGLLAMAGIVWSLYSMHKLATEGDSDWANSLRYAMHFKEVPKLKGGHVIHTGLREEIRVIWVYGEPAEISKLVDKRLDTYSPGDRFTGFEFPPAVLPHMTPEDFMESGAWSRDWPDPDPRGHTRTSVWLSASGTSAIVWFYSSTH